MRINEHFAKLEKNYLFMEIAQKVAAFQENNPDAELIRMGIGDVTRPLAPAVIHAMAEATAELGRKESFRGYPPDQGYDFLRGAIQTHYAKRGVKLSLEEIFVGDGAKSDIGNILDLFDADNEVLIPDPVYPVYVDTNRMAGRRIRFLNATEENGFLPLPDEHTTGDILYLCSPNNPTGAVYDRAGLARWVAYANAHDGIILFDAAYEAFIQEEALPHSIFEIPGAERCAIEFCSLSKTAGFTGVRCGYTIVPKALRADGVGLNQMWARRQATKFNGVSYVTQRGAAAVFSAEGQRQIQDTISYYRGNAAVMTEALKEMGVWFTGGENSPYIWLRCPEGQSAWAFFDDLLQTAGVVGTPGSGFGENGEGYFRLTAFGDRQQTALAMKRMKQMMKRGV